MSVFTLENFKFGLDSRRSELTSQPGVLQVCENALINQGGEAEKRKAFYNHYRLSGLGWEMTKYGLVAFDSGAKPAGWNLWVAGTPPSAQNWDNSVYPPRIYMRLLVNGGGNMVSFISSCVYRDIPFVIASFTSGGNYFFYDSTPLADVFTGSVNGDAAYASGSGFGLKFLSLVAAFLKQFGPGYIVYGSTFDTVTPSMSFVFYVPPGTTITNASVSAGNTGIVTLTVPQAGAIGIAITGTWHDGDIYAVNITVDGVTYVVGGGNLVPAKATFCYTYGKRVYVLANDRVAFSAIDRPMIFNDVSAAGNGYIDLSNSLGSSEPLVSMSHYQGKLAFGSRQNIQLWQPDANPANFQLLQVLENTGPLAKLAMTPLGDLDVFYLSDSGERSLRVRDISNNAYVNDTGAAINSLIQTLFITCTDAEKAAACSGLEPKNNRLFLFIPNAASGDKLYTLSYYPTLKIVAWSSATPSYFVTSTATLSTFKPTRFFVRQGVLFCVGYDNTIPYIFAYDGSVAGNTSISADGYDDTAVIVETPWLDVRKPGHIKQSTAIDYEMTGSWALLASMDYRTGTSTLKAIITSSVATPDKGSIAWSAQGTHVKMRATTSARSQALLSALIWHYNEMGEKK